MPEYQTAHQQSIVACVERNDILRMVPVPAAALMASRTHQLIHRRNWFANFFQPSSNVHPLIAHTMVPELNWQGIEIAIYQCGFIQNCVLFVEGFHGWPASMISFSQHIPILPGQLDIVDGPTHTKATEHIRELPIREKQPNLLVAGIANNLQLDACLSVHHSQKETIPALRMPSSSGTQMVNATVSWLYRWNTKHHHHHDQCQCKQLFHSTSSNLL